MVTAVGATVASAVGAASAAVTVTATVVQGAASRRRGEMRRHKRRRLGAALRRLRRGSSKPQVRGCVRALWGAKTTGLAATARAGAATAFRRDCTSGYRVLRVQLRATRGRGHRGVSSRAPQALGGLAASSKQLEPGGVGNQP